MRGAGSSPRPSLAKGNMSSGNTGKAIAIDALQRSAIGFPASMLDSDVVLRDFILSALNAQADQVWNMRSWDNEKVDAFQISPDADGIIKFASTVDIVRGLRRYTADQYPDGYPIYAQDELINAMNSNILSSDFYELLADSDDGCRRVRVNVNDAAQVYTAIVVKRFVPFTLANWLTVTFPIDRATTALVGFVADDIRAWQNLPKKDLGAAALAIALDRDIRQQNRDTRAVPRYPYFREAGNW